MLFRRQPRPATVTPSAGRSGVRTAFLSNFLMTVIDTQSVQDYHAFTQLLRVKSNHGTVNGCRCAFVPLSVLIVNN